MHAMDCEQDPITCDAKKQVGKLVWKDGHIKTQEHTTRDLHT